MAVTTSAATAIRSGRSLPITGPRRTGVMARGNTRIAAASAAAASTNCGTIGSAAACNTQPASAKPAVPARNAPAIPTRSAIQP